LTVVANHQTPPVRVFPKRSQGDRGLQYVHAGLSGGIQQHCVKLTAIDLEPWLAWL
jgi:hypothetical protein